MTTTPPDPDSVGAFREGRKKRGLAWLWWLLALLAAAIIAIVVVFLVRHHDGNHKGSTSAGSSSATGRPPSSSSTAGSRTSSGTGPTGAALVGGGGAAPAPASGPGVTAATAGIVLFSSASADIDANGQQVIASTAQEIKNNKTTAVSVVGYTDVLAGQVVNDPLSQQRADNVAAALRTLLGPSVTVTATARGQADPVATNDTESGRAQNRRAVITTS